MKLTYVYDALCGWCYGFSPVITEFCRTHSDEFTVAVLSGGMMTGERVQPVSVSMGYIEQAYKTVETRTGVRFGQAYLTNLLRPGLYLSDSTPPGVALTVFKTHQTGQDLAFAATLQHALYHDGIDLNVPANYGPLVATFGLDADGFVAQLAGPEFRRQTLAEFGRVAEYGISGFPTVIFDKGDGKLYLLAQGYVPLPALEQTLQRVLAA
jgi:putative protein-disulfide isomerase